jgi:signal transduction histidine kinase
MWESELIKFIILASIILFVFIWGILVFIFKYQKRKIMFEREKVAQDERHFREMLFTKIEIQQHTMRDIGREIHDNVGQRLTLAAMYAYQLEFEQKETATGEKILAIGKIIDESLEELRSLSKSLTNTNAERSELKELVENECKRVNGLNFCKASFTYHVEDVVLSPTIKSFIHRILQEFIQNSLKHAHCKNITMDFDRQPTGLTISLADDGRGFDMESYTHDENKGIGLINMKKRAELLGAAITMSSQPGQGTSLRLFIPDNKLNA